MSNIIDKKEGVFICERLFVDLNMSIEECAKTIGVSSKTVYKWIKVGNWHEKKKETQTIDYLVNLNLKRALNQTLINYVENPKKKDIQNLMSLLMQFKDHLYPSKNS